MFPGLTSRCTSPAPCAASSADATGDRIAAARPGGSGPSRCKSPRTSPPDTYRIAMNNTPPASPASYTGMMCGSSTAAAARDSRRNRRRNPGSPASPGSAASTRPAGPAAHHGRGTPPPSRPRRSLPPAHTRRSATRGQPTRPAARFPGQPLAHHASTARDPAQFPPASWRGPRRPKCGHTSPQANPSIWFSQTPPQPRDRRQGQPDPAPVKPFTGQGRRPSGAAHRSNRPCRPCQRPTPTGTWQRSPVIRARCPGRPHCGMTRRINTEPRHGPHGGRKAPRRSYSAQNASFARRNSSCN